MKWEEDNMIKVYRYLPAWTVPCISPYVTKVVNYLKMTGLEYEPVSQDLTKLDQETPFGKLPKIDDNGETVADSTNIINYLKGKYGDKLDGGLSPETRAQMLAWNRLIDEHLYWVAVIQPRWRETANWEKYLRIIAGTDDVPAPLRAFADDFRFRILTEFMLGGWGRMPGEVLYNRARADIDAMSDNLNGKKFMMGNSPTSIDAAVSSMLRHIVDTPFVFDTKDYAASKPNLKAYLGRMKEQFDI
jgi:isoprene-epoxide---glutathione S-transferase